MRGAGKKEFVFYEFSLGKSSWRKGRGARTAPLGRSQTLPAAEGGITHRHPKNHTRNTPSSPFLGGKPGPFICQAQNIEGDGKKKDFPSFHGSQDGKAGGKWFRIASQENSLHTSSPNDIIAANWPEFQPRNAQIRHQDI